MDSSALTDNTMPTPAQNNETGLPLLPDTDELPMQSSPADANEVSAQLLPDDDIPTEIEPTMADPSENGHSTPADFPQPGEITGGTSEGADRGENNEDKDENNDDDEEMDSDVSEGEDLQDDLQDALDDQNFSFTGTFYHANLLTTAPNPCLHISGLGLVGLPLSDRDAKSIISYANLAPFGHGERTLVDKTVRDTWEIEPARVTFANPHWEHYVRSTVIHEVCKSLGVTIGNHPPKLELYKLLLYERGSHFLPHQDTQKADGMFATVIIILPSAYTGGQVVVSHASTTKTIDFAPNSLLSTALLAWYTDVKHEVKEVTSGYRLALSYNLIHDAPSGSIPRPGLPNMDDAVVSLRRVLKKWKAGKYDKEPKRHLIAYLLDHQYSTANLHVGLKALKGADAHRVTFLRTVAEELEFRVGLASLEHNIMGEADDYGEGYHCRGRYDYDDDEDEDEDDGDTPGMLEVLDTSTKISGLVNLDGKVLISVGKISVGSEELIPKDPFDGEDPDETDYEGYTGNAAGQLEYWYRRTVLVIMPEDQIDDVCFSVEGIPYAFRKLKESTTIPPTQVDRQWAERVIKKDGSLTKEHIVTLMDYALKWRDLTMWKGVMKLKMCVLQIIDVDILLKAWELFSFEAVCISFEEILARSTRLPERMKFLSNIRPNASAQDKHLVLPWCQKESDKILSSYTTATVGDVPTIMTVIRGVGLQAFKKIVMPNLLKKKDNYAFWIAFIKTLREGREAILERESKRHRLPEQTSATADPSPNATTDAPAQVSVGPTQAQGADVVDNLIKECLQAAASRWSDVPAAPPYRNYYSRHLPTQNQSKTLKVDRIVEVVEEAITISDLDNCRNLFADIIKVEGQIATKFDDIYIPLIPRLRNLLAKKQLALLSAPFADLFQVLIGLYLRDILGKKVHMNVRLRKIGCGCGDCNMVDAFILDPKTSKTVFRLMQTRRVHLERQLSQARDLCTFVTIRSGSPHGIQVMKHPKVVQASSWNGRQKAAKAFLTSIGPDTVIAQIMGPRYAEVQQAVEGVAPFGSAETALAPAPTIGASHVPQPATAVSSSGTSSAIPLASAAALPTIQPVPSQVAGKKRKNLVQLGPVIDLTEDD